MKKFFFAILTICSLSVETVIAGPSILIDEITSNDKCVVLDGSGIETLAEDVSVHYVTTRNDKYIFTCNATIAITPESPKYAMMYTGTDCEINFSDGTTLTGEFHNVVTPSGKVTLQCREPEV